MSELNKRFVVNTTEEEHKKIRRLAVEQDKTISDIIRESIRAYVELADKKNVVQVGK